jgi:hypothetical protein
VSREFYDEFLIKGKCKSLRRNLNLRRDFLKEAGRRESYQRDLWTMCRRDQLFFCNVFNWTFDPRSLPLGLPSTIPFITWDFQDGAFERLEEAIMTGHDMAIEKSRDMGASWMFLAAFDHKFLFYDMLTFLLVSKKQEDVDQTGDPDCLMWKLDFMHNSLPGWMLPPIERNSLHMTNLETGSTIDGDSTTGNVGRGGRRTAIGIDEFGAVPVADGFAVLRATGDATDCRIFNSTPQGTANAYYHVVKTCGHVVRLHWTQHPKKIRGLYYCEKGKCVVHPEGGKPHSHWYDYQCKRRGYNVTEIAQELDIDYTKSGGQFFNAQVIEDYIQKVGRHWQWEGRLDYDIVVGTPDALTEENSGQLRLWVRPGMDGRLAHEDYVVAADISEGTGASFSCASIGCPRTGERIGEYSNPLLKPYEFARFCVALSRFLTGPSGTAFLIWEANGPGREFGDQVLTNLHYDRVYYRTAGAKITGSRSAFPGWWSTNEEKIMGFGAYRRAISDRTFMNRSKFAMKDCLKYVTNEDGVPEYKGLSANMNKIGQSHGDIVISDMLLVKGMEECRTAEADKPTEEPKVLPGSLMWRRQEMQKRLSSKSPGSNW